MDIRFLIEPKGTGSSEKMRKPSPPSTDGVPIFDAASIPVNICPMIQLPSFSFVRQSDFWQFFGITIIRELQEEDLTYYRLQTGGFQDEVDLMLVVDEQQNMSAGFLGLKRTFVTGSPFAINPFALDIVRSFIALAIGNQDEAAGNFLRLLDDEFLKQYRQDVSENGTAATGRIPELDAYLGSVTEVMRRFPGCDIRLKNAGGGNGNTLQIIISATG